MIKSSKLHAYAVAAQFGDVNQGFLACCPYVASEAAIATAQVVALIKDDTKTPYPLVAVHAIELPPEWMRSALQHIDDSEKAEQAEKPKVVQLVSDNVRWVGDDPLNLTPIPRLPEIDGASQHSLACPKRWGGWGHCRCGAA